jgi:hypothetical protein
LTSKHANRPVNLKQEEVEEEEEEERGEMYLGSHLYTSQSIVHNQSS